MARYGNASPWAVAGRMVAPVCQQTSNLRETGMSNVSVEVMPWLSRYFGTGHQGRVVLEREMPDGATVKDLLEEISSQNREFRDVLFDLRTGRPGRFMTIVLNGRLLELAGGLETKLKPGDTILLMAALAGGYQPRKVET